MTATTEATTLSVIANRAELVECLAAVSLAARPRSPKPILACVRIKAEGKAVELYATDFEIYIQRIASVVQIDATGTVCVSAFDLLEWLRLLGDDSVALTVEADELIVKGNDGIRSLPTMPAVDFPPTPEEQKETAQITVSLDGLRAAVGFVSHAIAKNTTRYVFSGVLLESASKTAINAVATEGHIMAVVGVAAKVEGKVVNTIIPKTMLAAALKAMPDEEGAEVVIGIANNAVRIQSGDATTWSLLLEGVFPSWKDHLNVGGGTFVTVGREDLLACVRRASAAVDESSTGLRLKIVKSGGIEMSLNSARGKAGANFPCKVTGDDLEWVGNAKFLIDCLGSMVGNDVTIEWASHNRPAKFTCGAMTEIIMPVNLR